MSSSTDLLTAARAEALFASDLSALSHYTGAEVGAAIARSVRRHHGTRGCAGAVAVEFGDHPETAAPRMRWARELTDAFYSRTRAAA